MNLLAKMTSFVSARELEAAKQLKKEQNRAMREEILKEAKENFEKEKKRRERKRERGEDEWMAPGVSERLGFRGHAEEPVLGKKKAKKKAKGHHKHKRCKSKKSKHTGNGGSSSSGSESESDEKWVEAGAKVDGKRSCEITVLASASDESLSGSVPLKREDWMTMPLAPSASTMAQLAERSERRGEKERERKEKKSIVPFDTPGQHPLELNPFWKEGGTGLPQQDGQGKEERTSLLGIKEGRGRDGGGGSGGERPKRTGDGGRSWMLRAYKRALEQAESEGKSLERIAEERWGSVEKLNSLLRAAGIDPSNPDAHPTSGRKKEYLYSHFRDDETDRVRRRRRREGESYGERRSGEDREYRRESRLRERGGDREREDGREKGSRSRRDVVDRERGGRDWVSSDHDARKSSKGSRSSGTGGFLRPGESESSDSNRFAGLSANSLSHATPSTSHNWRKAQAPETAYGGKAKAESPTKPPEDNSPKSSKDSPPGPSRTQDIIEVPVEPITDTQLNSLGAKLMKAEMMGDSAKVERLSKELEKLRKMKQLQTARGGEASDTQGRGGRGKQQEERTLVLTKTDRFGRTKPLEFPSRAGPSKTPTHTKKGKREKYFADDDDYSLKALVELERMTTAEETHDAIARMASKFVPASNAGETVDDVIDSKSATKHDPAKEEERQRKKAMFESKLMADTLERCTFCFDNPQFPKHLLIAVGLSVYLTVPSHQSLTTGHCLLVPMEHATCSMGLDENVWSEVKVFQKGLTHMFAAQNMDVVFIETYMSTRAKSHMYIECIPIPNEEGEMIPMYFKKAILESDEEWSQNKKLVDTRQKGVRKSIPAGLPYFFVDFGLDGGYAHIIEDQTKFPHYFGREVIGGLMDLEPRLWLKPPRESFEKEQQKVVQLSEWWRPYDWTQKLKNE